ncbi:MAG TPA: hypothetical protein VGX71_09930 [Pseudaminobacter sp.]|nr:hypothetical protein [Pseudaminobacter sp.]
MVGLCGGLRLRFNTAAQRQVQIYPLGELLALNEQQSQLCRMHIHMLLLNSAKIAAADEADKLAMSITSPL